MTSQSSQSQKTKADRMARQANMEEKLKVNDLVRTANDKIGRVKVVMEPYCKVTIGGGRKVKILLYKIKDVKKISE